MSIRYKILGSVLTIIALFLFTFGINFYFLIVNKNKTEKISEVYRPSLQFLNELNELSLKSKNLAGAWRKVELEDHEDKKNLQLIHATEYPQLKKNVLDLSEQWDVQSSVDSLKQVIRLYEIQLAKEKALMGMMVKFEDYADFMKVMEADALVDEVNKSNAQTTKALVALINNQRLVNEQKEKEMLASMNTLQFVNIITAVLLIALCLFIGFYLSKIIINPVNAVKDIILQLGQGELVKVEMAETKDELGQMTASVVKLVEGLSSNAHFAAQIGEGVFESAFQPLSEKDVLGKALLEMRDNLSKASVAEKNRTWNTQGIAQFAGILRSNNENIELLSREVISHLVKYLNANQGGIFIADEVNGSTVLKLTACFAYNRIKSQQKEILPGESLIGQCWLEKEPIYMTDVPDHYTTITSGLGEATPGCIAIVPLKINDEMKGVIEIASFNVLADYELDFLNRVCTDIASTVSAVKINERTARLLSESNELTEQLRSQEEELRQNQEEMLATTEETERQLFESKQLYQELLIENKKLKEKLGFSSNS